MAGKKLKKWPFVKMQANGNDMILINCMKSSFKSPPHTAKKICNRKTGIGADQLILLTKAKKPNDYGMKIYNIDGSEAEMCGNGLRALAIFIRSLGLTKKKEMLIETKAGQRKVKFRGSKSVEADMGEPILKGKQIPVNLSGRVINRTLRMENKEFRITCVGMGNPHCIIFQEDVDNFDVERFGPLFETYQVFPRKVNVSFVNVMSEKQLNMRIWERGAGETLSCGTAACASTVASVLNGYSGRKVTIAQKGGKLEVEWNKDNNHVYLRGPVEIAYTGEISL